MLTALHLELLVPLAFGAIAVTLARRRIRRERRERLELEATLVLATAAIAESPNVAGELELRALRALAGELERRGLVAEVLAELDRRVAERAAK